MTLASIQLVLGFAVLTVAADQLVVGAARVAVSMRISAVIVGAVIIGFGTSAPEVVITVLAGLDDAADVAAGNLIGSNIANIALVASVAALITPIFVSSRTLRRELPLATGSVIVLALALQGGLSRLEGAVLLALFCAVAVWVYRSARGGDEDVLGPEAQEDYELEPADDNRREALRTLLGLAGTVAGAQLVVMGAQGVSSELGLAEGFVGLTLVAIGTSLPELVTAVQAARRGHPDLIVGNVLGSSLLNSLLAGGILALVAPGPFESPDLTGFAAWLMVGTMLAFWAMMGTGRRIVRWEAVLLICAYAAMLPLLAR